MTQLSRDTDEILRALAELQRQRQEELARGDADPALSSGELEPLSSREAAALRAATKRRLARGSAVPLVEASRAARLRWQRAVAWFGAIAAGFALLAVGVTKQPGISPQARLTAQPNNTPQAEFTPQARITAQANNTPHADFTQRVGSYIARSRPSALPDYDLMSPPSDAATRGEAAAQGGVAAQKYTLGRELRFVLRARSVTDQPVQVAVFSERGGAHRITGASAQRAEGGSVVVEIATGPTGYAPEPGSDTLLFVLGARVPETAAELARSRDSAALRQVRLQVLWLAAPDASR